MILKFTIFYPQDAHARPLSTSEFSASMVINRGAILLKGKVILKPTPYVHFKAP
jgi:hypothetical protein